MKSLEQLTEQLLGIRISAANQTLWNIGATIQDRARVALNDAIQLYRFPMREVFSSIVVDGNTFIAVLPPTVKDIITVHALDASGGSRDEVFHYRHMPTVQTNLLYLQDDLAWIGSGVQNVRALEISYETRPDELPPSGVLGAVLNTVELASIVTSGITPAAWWKSPGYLELSDPTNVTDAREVVRYETAVGQGFTTLKRSVEGIQLQWPIGTKVSPIFEAGPEALPVIMASAEANMYNFWISHRAMYDQYTAAAGIAALEMKDVLGLVRSAEDRADRRYRNTKEAPPIGQIKTRRRPW